MARNMWHFLTITLYGNGFRTALKKLFDVRFVFRRVDFMGVDQFSLKSEILFFAIFFCIRVPPYDTKLTLRSMGPKSTLLDMT